MNAAVYRLRQAGLLISAILVCEAVGVLGSLATQTGPDSWYATIEKPAFTPPNWLFGVMWTLLYALMGVAAYLVWRRRRGWGRAL